MGDTPSLLRKRLMSSALLTLIGIALVIIGGLLFLNSLGSGGGYFAAALIISGVVLVLVAILKSIIKAVR